MRLDISANKWQRLVSEWQPQDALLLAWPDRARIWEPEVSHWEVQEVFCRTVAAVTRYERAVIATTRRRDVCCLLLEAGVDMTKVLFADVRADDCWARDTGPLTVRTACGVRLLDFRFDGWGGRYASSEDDRLCRRLHDSLPSMPPLESLDAVLEGGAIDVDDDGALLTTVRCLLSRGSGRRREEWERLLALWFGAGPVFWLEHGYIAGDDTGGHVDMLARFAPDGVIVHAACEDVHDEHSTVLAALARELRGLRRPGGDSYRLVPLYLPRAVRAPDGHRLPASYVNFVVINHAVLMPTYRDVTADNAAAASLSGAFPGREVIGIDCVPLIHQHGSLHCVTMQLPEGVLG